MLARWYMLLGQFLDTFEYRPGAQQMRTVCLDSVGNVRGLTIRYRLPIRGLLMWTPRRFSWISRSMDADLLPELSGEIWMAATLLEGLAVDLPSAGSDIDLIVASRQDATLTTVREWAQSGAVPAWSACSGLSPEFRCWRLQFGNLSVDTEGRLWRCQAPTSGASQLMVPVRERQDMIRRFHDSLFAGHLGVSRKVYRLLDRVYRPGLRRDVCSYLTSCAVCLARKSPYPRRAPMGSHGTPMGLVGYGSVRHVFYHSERQLICPGNGGLFFSMDGSLPAA